MNVPDSGLWSTGIAVGAIAGLVVLHSRRALTWVALVAGALAFDGLVVGAKLQYRLERLPLGPALRITPAELVTSGVRLPLGLLLGGTLAALWCLAMRAPWRDTGDALAVAGTAMIPIGRLGCWLRGCCAGAVCDRWALPVCVSWPHGTATYNQQLRDGLVTLSDRLSLPTHPLPLYFAAGSVAIFLLLVWLHRRHAPPGTMLVTACFLGSAGKLLLEPLRAVPRPPGLMFTIPTAVLVVTGLILVTALLRRERPVRVAACEVSATVGEHRMDR